MPTSVYSSGHWIKYSWIFSWNVIIWRGYCKYNAKYYNSEMKCTFHILESSVQQFKVIHINIFTGYPRFFITAWIRSGMLWTSDLQYSGVISVTQTRFSTSFKSFSDVRRCAATLVFISCQQFSITFKSGEFGDQSSRSWTPLSVNHFFTILATWQEPRPAA